MDRTDCTHLLYRNILVSSAKPQEAGTVFAMIAGTLVNLMLVVQWTSLKWVDKKLGE